MTSDNTMPRNKTFTTIKSLMQKGVNKKGLPNNQRYNEGGRLNQIPKVK